MTFTDEWLESWFRLLGKAEQFARDQWGFLNGKFPSPARA
jgi:hypothetical protein